MKKLNIKGEFSDRQQEKHKAYLRAGFKLISTKKSKDGIVKRVYQKV